MKLINGNNLDVLSEIPDNSIDLILTDPPYEHVMGGMKSKRYNVGSWDENSYMNLKMSQFKHDDIFIFLDSYIPKMKKVNMFIFCSKLQLAHYFDYLNNHKKLKFDLLIWDKSSKDGKYSMKSSKFFTQDIEYVVRIYESGISLNKIIDDTTGKTKSSLYMKRQSFLKPIKIPHDSPKPVKLLEQYINLTTDEHAVILDPFMGSCSTGVACVNTNRNFIGIELDETYFKIAENRIREAQTLVI
ncbi:DNA-methyltransferase [Leuconostoc mesenteroides]|uniref:DNA-methyltransferase n=1 Tax=Leuconostoc mesenteroides TaxID=1245 RepID=UPI002360DE48|nr:DNA methyltransferase [Leuconostoc mesenteroides]